MNAICAMQQHYSGSRSISKRTMSMQIQSSPSERTFDVVVMGGGIAGSSISYLLQAQQGLTVAVVDPR